MGRVRVGVVGWNYPEWKGLVYTKEAKPADFLRQYAERFPMVEAASTAYGMPKTETVATWAAAVPDGFEVSAKVPDWIVAKKGDDPDLPRALGVLADHLRPLSEAGKLGTVVAQFPPRWSRDRHAVDLEGFVRAFPRGPRWAVELRHASWWDDATYALLREAGVTLVWSALADGFRTPPVVTSRSLYVRLFGDRELQEPYDRKRRDARTELEHWAREIAKAAPEVERADVVVSKFLEGYAPGSAATLVELLTAEGLAPEGPVAQRARQTTLFGG